MIFRTRLMASMTLVVGLATSGCSDRRFSDGNAAAGALGPNLAAPRGALSALPAGDGYFAFTASPAAPLAFNEPGWDVQEYSREVDTWYTPEPMSAHHGMD
jgi:hypothetical protein